MTQITNPPAVGQARLLISVAAALFVTHSASLMVVPLLVDIAAEFETSVAVAGQLATATFAAWVVSVLITGPMSDSFGRRPVALAGLSLLSIGVLASAFAPNMGTLIAFRVLTGLGGGMIPSNSVAAVADVVAPARRAKAVSQLLAFNNFASVISISLLALAADWGGWRFSFLIMGSLLAVVALLNWFWFPNNEGSRLGSFSIVSRYRALLSIPIFRSALLVNLAQRMAFFALFSYLAAYLINDYDMSVAEVALPLAVLGMGRVIGSYLAGTVGTRRDRMPLIAVFSLAGGIVSLLLFSINVPVWVVVGMAAVAMALLSVGWPVLLTLSTEVSGRSRATGVGLMGVGFQMGGVSGAAIGGVLLATSGFPGVGYLCLGAALASALMTVLFMRNAGADAKLLPGNPLD